MDKFGEQLHTIANEIKLTDNEKLLMREKVLQYMEMKPIRGALPSAPRVSQSSFVKHFSVTSFSSFARARFVPAALVAGLIISTSAGVSYAAESALPGDILYPVKVNMNEPVGGVFLFSEQARIDWFAQLAERRLEEASILTAQGRLDTEKSKEVTSLFEAHAAEIKARAEQLEMSDPVSAAETSAKVATTLGAHEAILARLAVENDTPATQASELVGQVRTAAKALARISEDAEERAFTSTTTDVPASFEGGIGGAQGVATSSVGTSTLQKAGTSFKEGIVIRMRTAARDSLDQAYKLLGKIENQSSESAVRTKAHIDATEAAFVEGQELLSHGEYDKAYHVFKNVAADARTVLRLLNAETLFQVEILPPSATSSDDSGDDTSANNVTVASSDKSIRANQVLNTRGRVEQLITEGQQAVLNVRSMETSPSGGSNVDDDTAIRATNFLKEAKAFKLRGDVALLSDDTEEAGYLFRQANELAQRTLTLLRPVNEKDTKNNPSDTISGSDMVPPLMLDVIQVHHTFTDTDKVHTYFGVFITPTTCFALAATTSQQQENVTLFLTTTETNTSCPTKALDEKPFYVTVSADASATMTAVMLNGSSSKFVVIEGEGSTTTSILDTR